jgi:FtsH-binding integral membrane protein
MADYDNRVVRSARSVDAGLFDAGLRAHMLSVYNYMLVGLALTGMTAWVTADTAFGQLFYRVNEVTGRIGMTMLGLVALFAPLGLVLLLSFRINRMSVGAAQATFWAYAGLVGIGIAPVLLVYTGASVAEVFFITAATFGAMSLWGYTTRADLSGMGSFLFMGLIGIVIAGLVNLFLHSSGLQFAISLIGVVVFTGLTAWDTQSIKEMYWEGDGSELAGKKAIMGALRLYLDFINLFIMLMQLMGNRRN